MMSSGSQARPARGHPYILISGPRPRRRRVDVPKADALARISESRAPRLELFPTSPLRWRTCQHIAPDYYDLVESSAFNCYLALSYPPKELARRVPEAFFFYFSFFVYQELLGGIQNQVRSTSYRLRHDLPSYRLPMRQRYRSLRICNRSNPRKSTCQSFRARVAARRCALLRHLQRHGARV